MTREDWKNYLGATKFSDVERIVGTPGALEALEDVLCQEIKNDNINEPSKPADATGNFFYAYIDKLGPGLDNAMLGEKLRCYQFALMALQRAVKELEKFKAEPEAPKDSDIDSV